MEKVLWALILIVVLVGVFYAWRHRVKRLLGLLLLVLAVLSILYIWQYHRFGVPNDYGDIQMQFKYGSIGTDHPLTRGIPYWIWRVLPEVLPPSEVSPVGFKPQNGKAGYEAFGFPMENKDGVDRPIGFSKRRVFGMDFIGANCAFCHVSTIRKTPKSEPEIILGMPGNTEDPEKFFVYLFAAVTNPRFTADQVMDAILKPNHNPHMSYVERLVYRYAVIPLFRREALKMKKTFDFVDPENPAGRFPVFGPGRVETWAVYKKYFADPPLPVPVDLPGISDTPAIWNQKARVGMKLHWDGNNEVLGERNIIAALGVIGPRVEYLDLPRLNRITDWITWLMPPRYEDRMNGNGYSHSTINWKLMERGKGLYQNYCAACHAPDGERIGRVEPIEELGTDKYRIESFTSELATVLNQLGNIKTDGWELRHFKPQRGYVNELLDGVWLRAPYLHNGSVPTLRDLLNRSHDRPNQFCRGNDLYDWKNVGFVSAMTGANGKDPCGEFFLYDTSIAGNSNGGHLYGTDLPDADKEALLEYLKTR